MAGKRGHGEGTIYKRKDGRWEGKLTIGYDTEGKPKRKTFYGKTRREVQEKMDKVKADLQAGTFVESNKITFEQWLNRWLEVYVKPKVKPATFSNYVHLARTHIIPSLGKIELQKLTTDIIQEFYNQKSKSGRLDGSGGLSPRIIHMMHQVISGTLKQAVKQRMIVFNPADATTRPRLKYKEMNPLTADEVKQYLDAARNERLHTAFLLELTTGMRRGELLALKWEDIDFDKGTLTVKTTLARVRVVDEGKSKLMFSEPKTEKGRRTIPVLPETLKELKAHKARQAQEKLLVGQAYQDNGLVFCTPEGKPIEPRGFHRKHTEILKKAGLRHVRVHDLRHTFATILLEANEDPKTIQELLGHAKVSTTLDLYCHSSINMKQQSISKLGGLLFTGTEKKK